MGHKIIMKTKKIFIISLLAIAWIAGLVLYVSLEKHFDKIDITAKTSLLFRKNLASVARLIFNDNYEVIGVTREVSIPVLVYHGIVEQDDGVDVTIENFRSQMATLKANGYVTIDTHDLFAFYTKEAKLPEKPVMITFDDGRRDSYLNGDPILKENGFKVVMFVVTEKQEMKNSFFLNWDELDLMYRTGRWDVQAHGYQFHNFIEIDSNGNKGHFGSNKMWISGQNRLETDEEYKKRLLNDHLRAKNDLESYIKGLEVIAFAYPFGDYGQESLNFPKARDIVLEITKSVYPLSFYQAWGTERKRNYFDMESYLIGRIEVSADWSDEDLLSILENSNDKPLPYKDHFDRNNGWLKNWGDLVLKDNLLIVRSSDSTTGGLALLDGTYLWDNYIFEGKVNLVKGSSFSLIGRYQDRNNYLSCNFSKNGIILKEKIDGGEKTLLAWRDKFEFLEEKDIEVGLYINGNRIRCMLNGNVVLTTDRLNSSLYRGGVGFKIWDPIVNNSELIIKEISVEEVKN